MSLLIGHKPHRYDYVVQTACVKVICLDPVPSRSDVNLTEQEGNKYEDKVRYRCSIQGQEFRWPNKTFYEVLEVECLVNGSWSFDGEIPHPCEYRYCLDPPVPPQEHKLTVRVLPELGTCGFYIKR